MFVTWLFVFMSTNIPKVVIWKVLKSVSNRWIFNHKNEKKKKLQHRLYSYLSTSFYVDERQLSSSIIQTRTEYFGYFFIRLKLDLGVDLEVHNLRPKLNHNHLEVVASVDHSHKLKLNHNHSVVVVSEVHNHKLKHSPSQSAAMVVQDIMEAIKVIMVVSQITTMVQNTMEVDQDIMVEVEAVSRTTKIIFFHLVLSFFFFT